MNFYVITWLLILGTGIYWVILYRKRSSLLKDLISEAIQADEDIQKTLLDGLIYRFGRKEEGSESFWDFEDFVAKILEKYYGGTAYVTKKTGDFGVDVKHIRKDGMYLGQVKCYAENEKVNYEPIAIIHSQMVKHGAKEGFVITTSDFASGARSYAEGLNIKLINGQEFVGMWVAQSQVETDSLKVISPQEA